MELDRSEKLALEAVAIAMFESFLRQQASEGRGKSVQDWQALAPDERDFWRDAGIAMLREIRDR